MKHRVQIIPQQLDLAGNNTNFTTNVDTDNRNTRTGHSTQVSSQLKQKIENQVRAANKNVDEVFVSVN